MQFGLASSRAVELISMSHYFQRFTFFNCCNFF